MDEVNQSFKYSAGDTILQVEKWNRPQWDEKWHPWFLLRVCDHIIACLKYLVILTTSLFRKLKCIIIPTTKTLFKSEIYNGENTTTVFGTRMQLIWVFLNGMK